MDKFSPVYDHVMKDISRFSGRTGHPGAKFLRIFWQPNPPLVYYLSKSFFFKPENVYDLLLAVVFGKKGEATRLKATVLELVGADWLHLSKLSSPAPAGVPRYLR